MNDVILGLKTSSSWTTRVMNDVILGLKRRLRTLHLRGPHAIITQNPRT